MQNKTYTSIATALSVITALALATPALAASVNVPVSQEEQAEASNGHAPGWDEGGPMHNVIAGGAQRMPGVFGTVASITGTTLTVTSKMPQRPATAGTAPTFTATTYTVDATNATVTKNNAASTLSAVAVGDVVMVQGTVSGTNVAATVIRDGALKLGKGMWGQKGPEDIQGQPNMIIQGNGQPVVGGSVTAISGSTVTITNKSNVTYSVDATNAVIEKGNATSTISAIAVGDILVVQGAVNGSSITASSVIDQGSAPTNAGNEAPKPRGIMGFFSGVGGFFAHLFGF